MDMPVYPSRRPLAIEDKAVIDAAFAATPPVISELTFTNLYSFREKYSLSVSRRDGFILFVCRQDEKDYIFPPVGSGQAPELIRKLAVENGAAFFRVPEDLADVCRNFPGLVVEQDRDNWDYVYDIRSLKELKGRKYDGKRNLIRNFKLHNKFEYVSLDQGEIQKCFDFEEVWCLIRKCGDSVSLTQERHALEVMCHNLVSFGLIAAALTVEGSLSAITVAQKLNPVTLVMHLFKALPDMHGLYQTMLQEFLLRQAAGFSLLNMEQDLGIEGLRKAKLSYYPVEMVRKYFVGPATVSRGI